MNAPRTGLAAAFAASAVLCVTAAAAQVTPDPPAQPPASPGAPPAAPGQFPQPAEPPPPAWDPSMQAGGLAPPPPMTNNGGYPPPGGSNTEMQLDRAKKEDSGRPLEWFWVNLEGGFEHVGLKTFNVNEENFTAGFVDSTASGGMIGLGLGPRLLFLTIGARARLGFFDAWQLFSVGGELGFHIPLGSIEPHVDLGFGYTGLGSFSGAVAGAGDAIDIRGFYGRVGGGFDFFLTPVFSLGANVSWELLGLTRPGVSPSDIQNIKSDPSYDPASARADALQAEGTSYGSALAITAMAGLHF